MTHTVNAISDRPHSATLLGTLNRHWPLYLFEASELAIFMLSACAFTVFLFNPAFHAARLFPASVVRRLLLGLTMGITAVLIIHSVMGKRSGAHFNPAITLTYFRLGKIGKWDAFLYVLFQFAGGIFGVAVAAVLFRGALAAPSVRYAVTVPMSGRHGILAAFLAELFMSAVLMAVVLCMTSRPPLAPYTGYAVGVLISLDVLIFATISGFSINPARTVASAVFASIWTAEWLYFVAPLFGMMTAAEIFVRLFGAERILCAHLRPDSVGRCPFQCNFPGHIHPTSA